MSIHRSQTFTVLIAILALMLAPSWVLADFEWLTEVKDCKTFHEGVTKFYDSLKGEKVLSSDQKDNLKRVLEVACSPRFKHCKFSICRKAKGEDPTAPREKLSREELNAPIVLDPLAWLQGDLECEELVEQIDARYRPFGDFADLPAETKKEVRKVFSVACSNQFSRCNFGNCPGRVDGKPSSKTQLFLPDLLPSAPTGSSMANPKIALQEYREAYLAMVRRHSELIQVKLADEEKLGLEWGRFSVSYGGSESEGDDNNASRSNRRSSSRQPAGGYSSRRYWRGARGTRASKDSVKTESSKPDAPAKEQYVPPQKFFQ